MPLPVIADTLRVAFNWECSGQHAVNVMHFGGTEADYAALVTALEANNNGGMTSTMVGEASCTQLTVTPLDGTSASAELVLADWSGAVGSSDFVPAAAAVVSLRTALRGRHYRGRIFLPFTAESILSEGRFGSVLAAAVAGGWESFAAGMAGDGFPLLVASYSLAVAHPVVGTSCNQAAGTLRRRQSRLRL